MGRFDYIRYDEAAAKLQAGIKEVVSNLEQTVEALGSDGVHTRHLARSKAMALTKLEEFYMWTGKAVRDEQLIRTGETELQEERTDTRDKPGHARV